MDDPDLKLKYLKAKLNDHIKEIFHFEEFMKPFSIKHPGDMQYSQINILLKIRLENFKPLLAKMKDVYDEVLQLDPAFGASPRLVEDAYYNSLSQALYLLGGIN